MMLSLLQAQRWYMRFAVAWCIIWSFLPVHMLRLLANPSGGTVAGAATTKIQTTPTTSYSNLTTNPKTNRAAPSPTTPAAITIPSSFSTSPVTISSARAAGNDFQCGEIQQQRATTACIHGAAAVDIAASASDGDSAKE
ncbi:MAG TPA: hypothetical protein VK970_06735 [Candidatus Methylacidiphilales bacterium]|nr:hypothetical protein [Candidatus Methylacidiphilales bacterium]